MKQAEKIHRLGVYPFLSPGAVFISDTIGISKPNPKLWQRACAADRGFSCVYLENVLDNYCEIGRAHV